MNILFLDTTHPVLEEGLRAQGHEIVFNLHGNLADVAKHIAAFDGLIVRSRLRIGVELLNQA